MGQQQLLLIVLGFIIVTAAVAVVLTDFAEAPAETNRNQLVSDINDLSVIAQSYYKKPKEFGGGNNKFTGWKMPEIFENYKFGTITTKINKNGKQMKITAKGIERGKNRKLVEVEADVKPTSIKIKIKN
jgi:lipopolysaccharide export LptBFGC system permease protein LptF